MDGQMGGPERGMILTVIFTDIRNRTSRRRDDDTKDDKNRAPHKVERDLPAGTSPLCHHDFIDDI